jgi:UrcA family protein
MSLRLLVLASAAMTVFCVGSAATAADDLSSREVVVHATRLGVEVSSQKVSYGDLNLDSAAGARALLARIHSAAQNVCGGPDPALGNNYSACLKSAESNAVSQVGSPLLTAAFRR